MVIVPISVAISRYYGEKLRVYASEKQQRYSKYSGKVFEMLNSLRDIKLLSAQKKVFNEFTHENKILIKLNIKSSLTQMNGQNILNGSQLILQLLLFLALAYFAYVNEITIGSLIVVLAYYADVRLCADALVNSHLDAKIRVEYIKRLYDFIKEPEEDDFSEGETLSLKDGIIQYNNVSFQYDEKPLLKNITFKLSAAKRLAL